MLRGSTLSTSHSDVEGGIGSIHGEAGVTVNWGDGMIDADPLFAGGPSGTWTANGAFSTTAYQVTFEDTTASWTDGELVGKFLNPDTTQPLQFVITANTANTITIWADWTTIDAGSSWVSSGASYKVYDYHLTATSPCIDAGDSTAVPADTADLDGDLDTTERTPLDLDLKPRFADAPPPGGTGVADPPDYPEIVDMGAYEYPSDCNNNGILDPCDIDCGAPGGPCDVPGCGGSQDCNQNGIPDECEPQDDCQPNGILDFCDLYLGYSEDCQGDGIPDDCQLVDNDCNTNGVPDECEPLEDCNTNGMQDICDIASGFSQDCNSDGIPDDCQLLNNDCNTNGVPDECDPDFDLDTVIDDCDNCPQYFNPSQQDRDGDGIGDICDNCPDVANSGQEDSNGDGIGDVCPCPERGDMNDDGFVDGNDIQLFVEKLLGA